MAIPNLSTTIKFVLGKNNILIDSFLCKDNKSSGIALRSTRNSCVVVVSGWNMHGASCRLSLDHDEINKYLYENCIRRFDIGYICEAQYRKYNCIRKVVITLILTTKIEIADSAFLMINL